MPPKNKTITKLIKDLDKEVLALEADKSNKAARIVVISNESDSLAADIDAINIDLAELSNAKILLERNT